MDIAKIKIVTPGGTPVWVSGNGPTVILIHGVLVDHRMWAWQAGALAERYQVCCIDMLGHGDAPDPPGERTLDDFVEQVREVVDEFSDHGPPVLGGFSMGGLITQAYAARYHALLDGIIILNAVHDRSPEEAERVYARYQGNVDEGVEHAVSSGERRWFKPSDYEIHADEIAQTLSWMRDGDFKAKCKAHRVFTTSDGEVTGRLGAISCPALIMTGDEDAGSTPDMARKMAAEIPNAELHILDGQHHMMPVLDAPRVNRILLDFLDRCTA